MAITQALSALQAAVLAVLVFTDLVAVWHVMVLGGLLGIVSAFDNTPCRVGGEGQYYSIMTI
jgi:hypothetical protein